MLGRAITIDTQEAVNGWVHLNILTIRDFVYLPTDRLNTDNGHNTLLLHLENTTTNFNITLSGMDFIYCRTAIWIVQVI